MIKPEELRIGDYVRVSSDNCMIPKGAVCKVVVIDSERACEDKKGLAGLLQIVREEWEISHGIWSDYIEGIPLTPEILEKNGWKKRTEGWYFMMISKYMYLSVEFGYENGIRVFLKRTTDGLYVKLNIANNVHELQHILWALGKDANLKI